MGKTSPLLLPLLCAAALVSAAEWPGGASPPAEPALFAPGLVNAGAPVRDVAVSPDGNEFYFGVQAGEHALSSIAVLRRVDGAWVGPELLPFATDPRYRVMEPALSPDGQRLFFASDRPRDGSDGPAREDHDLWFCERDGDDWAAPHPVPGGVNSDQPDFFPSLTADGTLYFTRDEPSTGLSFLYRARPEGEGWGEAERLPDAAQPGRSRFNAAVAPDESWLIVPAYGLKDSRGVDYYLLRRSPEDVWSEPERIDAISSDARREWSATVVPDGSAVFFMSDRQDLKERAPAELTWNSLLELQLTPPNGQTAIWWIDSSFIDNMTK